MTRYRANKRGRTTAVVFAGLCVLAVSGCSPKQTPAKADFRATDTAGRVPAIVDAAGRDDAQTLAELVHALSDDDPAVRLFAVQSLRERTGQRFGYRYYDSADRRLAPIARWRDWLANHGGEPPVRQTEADTTAAP